MGDFLKERLIDIRMMVVILYYIFIPFLIVQGLLMYYIAGGGILNILSTMLIDNMALLTVLAVLTIFVSLRITGVVLLFCIWFWVSIILGNCAYGFVMKSYSLDVFRPFDTYINHFEYFTRTDKFWFLLCYAGLATGLFLMYVAIMRQSKFLKFLSRANKEKSHEDVFGGAKEASVDDMKEHTLVVPRNKTKITNNNKYICYGELDGKLIGTTELKNSCIFSKPGGGKGVTSVVPHLLDCPYPVVVNDIKSEMVQMVAAHRYKVFGKKAYIIDPFNEILKYDAAKWSDMQTLHIDMNIGGNVDMNVYVSTLSNAIAPKDSSGRNASYYGDAQEVLEGIIYYLVANNLNITQVFDLIVKKGLWFTKNKIEEFNETLAESSSAIYLACTKIKQLHEKGNLTKYGADVSGILVSGIKLFGQSSLKQMFAKADPNRTLNINEYLAGKADIYIVVPPNMVEQSAPFIKLILGLVKSALEFANPQQLQSKYYPVLLDEVAQLGYMKIIEQMYEVLRYKGIILWLYFQDMSQLKIFAKAAMFKSFDVLQFFEVNGDENIRFIKELAGTKTVEVESSGESKSNKNINSSINKSISRTELLSTDFIRELPKSKQIIFYSGFPVIVCDRTKYYEHKRYKGLAAKNLTRTELSHLIPKDNEEVRSRILAERKEGLKQQANNNPIKHKNYIKKLLLSMLKQEKNSSLLHFQKIEEYYYVSNDTLNNIIATKLTSNDETDKYIALLIEEDFLIAEKINEDILFKINT